MRWNYNLERRIVTAIFSIMVVLAAVIVVLISAVTSEDFSTVMVVLFLIWIVILLTRACEDLRNLNSMKRQDAELMKCNQAQADDLATLNKVHCPKIQNKLNDMIILFNSIDDSLSKIGGGGIQRDKIVKEPENKKTGLGDIGEDIL